MSVRERLKVTVYWLDGRFCWELDCGDVGIATGSARTLSGAMSDAESAWNDQEDLE